MISKNLKNFIKNDKFLFTIMVICIIISALIINFSYGLYQNYNIVKTNQEIADKELLSYMSIGVNYYDDSHYLTRDMLNEVLKDDVFNGMTISVDFYIPEIREKIDAINQLHNEEGKKEMEEYYASLPPEERQKEEQEDAERQREYEKQAEEREANYVQPSNETEPNVERPRAISAYFKIENGEFIPPPEQIDNLLNSTDKNVRMTKGRPYSNTEYATGAKVVMIQDDTMNTDGIFFGELFVEDNHITIQGEEYEVVGYSPMGNAIPFLSVKPETEIAGRIEIYPIENELFTSEQYKKIKEVFEQQLGDLVNMPALNFPDMDSYYLYNTIIIISVLISIVSALIIALLYNYILIKRHRTLTIFRICGCTRGKLVVMYLAECLLISVPIFILTSLAYYKLLLPILSKQYPNMEGAYSIKLYALIFGIYFVSSIIVMLVMISKTIPKKAVNIKGAVV